MLVTGCADHQSPFHPLTMVSVGTASGPAQSAGGEARRPRSHSGGESETVRPATNAALSHEDQNLFGVEL